MDAESLYRRIGRLLETMPDFSGYQPLSADHLTWLGRAHALVSETGEIVWKVEMDSALRGVQGPTKSDSIKALVMVLYKALAKTELEAPANVQGAFIPAGNAFDAFAAVTKVLQTATKDVLVVDPYLDETILTEFAGSAAENVTIRLLADQASVKASLAPAVQRWKQQHAATRPISHRVAAPRTLHDRALLIDGRDAWLLTQSLKDFAKRSPAEIVRADDTAALKIDAYEVIWLSATVVH